MIKSNEALNDDLKITTKNFSNTLQENVELLVYKYNSNKKDIETLNKQLQESNMKNNKSQYNKIQKLEIELKEKQFIINQLMQTVHIADEKQLVHKVQTKIKRLESDIDAMFNAQSEIIVDKDKRIYKLLEEQERLQQNIKDLKFEQTNSQELKQLKEYIAKTEQFVNNICQKLPIECINYSIYKKQDSKLHQYEHVQQIFDEIEFIIQKSRQQNQQSNKLLQYDQRDKAYLQTKKQLLNTQEQLLKEIFLRIKSQMFQSQKVQVSANFEDILYQVRQQHGTQLDQYETIVKDIIKQLKAH